MLKSTLCTHAIRCSVLLLALSIGCFADADPAQAQGAGPSNYPAKPVRLYVGTGPGSLADALTRVLAAALAELWKQQVIVESRPGAGNTIAPAIAPVRRMAERMPRKSDA